MEEEKTISMKDIMRVLLGNKWVYLIMAACFALVSFVGIKVFSDSKTEYVSFFDYDVAGFERVNGGTAYFIDGEKFDTRAMITKEKIQQFIVENEDLKELNIDNIVEKNGIKSYDYSMTYKQNDHQMNANDAAYVQDKIGYKLVLNSSLFTLEEAKAFSKSVANEVINITKTKIDHINYDLYLKSYDSCYSYVEKIEYLNDGIDYINNLISSLNAEYGDVLLSAANYGGDDEKFFVDTMKLSDWKNDFNIFFRKYKVEGLYDELEIRGYIDERSVEYITSLKTAIENLNREINTNQAILDKLTAQRDSLVGAIGVSASIESLEIGGYNTEIIELTKKIDEQKEKVARYKIQIDNLDLSGLTAEELSLYNTNLSSFNNKLGDIRENLEFYTKQYEAIAKKILKDKMNVYFDSSKIVEEEGGVSIITLGCASLAIGIFAPMLVNLVIAGFALGEGKPILKKKQ